MASCILCPECQTAFAFSPALLGKSVRCRQCGHQFTVGEPPADAPTPAPTAAAAPVAAAPSLTPPPLPRRAARARSTDRDARSRDGEYPNDRPRRRDDEPQVRRDPERSRRPRDAAPERPAGMGVLIGVVAACVLGFAAVAAGVGYLLWPRSDPSTAPASNNADSSAATPVVVDPPKTLDEVIKDAPRKPADAQGRLDSPPGGIRPPFPDPGRRIAPPPKLVAPNFAPVSALPIQATPLTDNLEERRLPGAVESVVSAGGGRLLLLHMPKARQLAVFDVNEGKTAKQIPVADAGALIAGGMNMFVVYSPGDNRAERWNTKTLEREGQINNPFPDPAKAIAMGSATNGPLVVALGGGRQTRLGGATLAYFDPVTGKELNYEFGGTQNAFGLGPPDSGATLRVSANGRVATAWGDPRFRRGAEVHSIDGVKITKYWERSGPHLVIPAPDGRVLYAPGQLFSPDYRPLGASKGGWPSGPWLLPAVQGDYYIAARRPDRARAGRGAPVIVEVFRNGADVPVFTIDRGSGVAVPDGLDGQTELLERSFILVPDARLLVVIPSGERDRLLLRRVDLKPSSPK